MRDSLGSQAAQSLLLSSSPVLASFQGADLLDDPRREVDRPGIISGFTMEQTAMPLPVDKVSIIHQCNASAYLNQQILKLRPRAPAQEHPNPLTSTGDLMLGLGNRGIDGASVQRGTVV